MSSISCILLFVSTSFAAVISNALFSLATNPVGEGNPICVNSSQFPGWISPDASPLNPYGCAYALLGVKLSLRNNSKANFDFYSKDESLIGPEGGWGLPFGAASATEGSGQCTVVVRMKRDFSSTALPYTNGSYDETSTAAQTQVTNWKLITDSLNTVQQECVNQKQSGWIPIGDGNIIAGMWPKGSTVDLLYGYNVSVATESRFLSQDMNLTDVYGEGKVTPY